MARNTYGYGRIGWCKAIDGSHESGRCNICNEKLSKYATEAGYTSHKECKEARKMELTSSK